MNMKIDLSHAKASRDRQQARWEKERKRKERKKKNKVSIVKNEYKPKKESIKVSIDPSSNAFLETYEWRRLRMEALKKYGATCQCCGASRKTGAVIHVDHIKPRKLFPHLALNISNLQVLCHECNHGKGNWDMTDWR